MESTQNLETKYNRIEIQGKRVLLQEIQPQDNLEQLLEWRNSQEYQKKLLSFESGVTMSEMLKEIQKGYNNDRLAHFIAWVDGKPIGTNWIYRYSQKNGIAYTTTFVAPEYRNSGYYGIEMFLLACKFLFEQKDCRKVYSEVHSDNTESKILFEKLGLPLEANLKNHTKVIENSFADLLIYALYREEFYSNPIVKKILR